MELQLTEGAGLVLRFFAKRDISQLLELMQALAVFERYSELFSVTEADIEQRGLGKHPEFYALIAHEKKNPDLLLGMAVFYYIPFSFDLSPELVLKELYVRPEAQGKGVGKALMRRLTTIALDSACHRIKWLVLHDNEHAKAFYTAIGAHQNKKWENWSLDLNKRLIE